MVTRLRIEYDGTDFAGWARQPEKRTVQEELERALQTILGASGVVGFSAVEEFLADPDCEVITSSRRKPEPQSTRPFRHCVAQPAANVYTACRSSSAFCGVRP